ncbi:16S rRNA (cytosine(1402)-N(4))-methyltransferase RsmH [Paenalcaligenes niemegkensis]|uniref:16S rRNA (cytosine(1402)-N(4))-methyltransferase RsmH n=1 Tax=Paenalcaligenes niemegkensis TaxID=2895469 RepID=UPI001EE86976|nr:16S rRNA (cytosine(1402)-N(4))-methyltransferase RsmH [Paenalcaligenes niemegkensis]MCQ9615883.1 16S rRNA (cytosine(1402)-N(4))-methyltransferase RsmH [Paenalcaligenes niemegkensis]
MELIHRSVLLEPTVAALVDPAFSARRLRSYADLAQVSGVFVDATFGRGGHSRELLRHLLPDAHLYVIDKDPEAIAIARELAAEDSRVHVIHAGFVSIVDELNARGISSIDGVMMDLGVSSPQLDDAERGFSFMRDGPLDMRMNNASGPTAAQWLAEADVDEIKEVIADYGEERFAFQIAKAIAARRESEPLRTTHDLAELVASVVRSREKGHHPATRTFQAIRIYINRELEELAYALPLILELLKEGGRLAVISFHSLEDRIVKQFFAAASRPALAQARLPIAEKDMPQPWLHSLGRVLPNDDDISLNVRARSAVLRIAERTATPWKPGGRT